VSAPVSSAVFFECREVRANPAYRLYAWELLPASVRRSVESGPAALPGAGGVLVGRLDRSLPFKVVDVAGADLFCRLRRPGQAPEMSAGRLTELVLDGVLEVRTADGFVSGPAAYGHLVGPVVVPQPRSRLARISHAAVAHAARLQLSSAELLRGRLYAYHRIPLSTRWRRAIPGPEAVLEMLRGPAPRHWAGPVGLDTGSSWLSWSRRGDTTPSTSFPYKLYVSPAVEHLADALPRIVEVLTATSAARFKVGAGAAGLLRPDKAVVYLRDAAELSEVAAALSTDLDGVQPHGVPFSAELAGGGLLSWGGDPLAGSGPVGGGEESWRSSVCRRLAEHLAAAQAAPVCGIEPAAYALARLAADGVDVAKFAPSDLDPPIAGGRSLRSSG
jgi:hypothetical protein